MAENTKIEWAHHTFNPWIGCTKVGPGCDHCYAQVLMDTRHGRAKWGAGEPRSRTADSNWKQPLTWNRKAAAAGIRQRVFCSSLADVFDNEVDDDWRDDLAILILATPHLDWLLLTKRIGNAKAMLEQMFGPGIVPANLWLGATIVNQAEADRDIPKLLATPAAKRFLSMEPLLGPVNLRNLPPLTVEAEALGVRLDAIKVGGKYSLDWFIVGGESGSGARPMHPDWARSLRDQCAAAGVPFLFKQWGEWTDMAHAAIVEDGPVYDRWGNVADWMRRRSTFEDGSSRIVQGHSWTEHSTNLMYHVGKRAAGRLLDGVQHDGVPA